MNSFLDGRSLGQKIEEAIEFLQENGYLVRGPLLARTEVKTPSQLVRFFYDTMARYRPDGKYGHAGSTQRDRALARLLIEARVSAGSGKKRAMQECCDIVELLFKYEHVLRLSYPIVSMSILGQDRLGWITERLLNIQDGADAEVNAAEDAIYYEELRRQQERVVDKGRLLKARERMDGVLERYGKKREEEG